MKLAHVLIAITVALVVDAAAFEGSYRLAFVRWVGHVGGLDWGWVG
ncbi:MAG: hypothetical protein M3N07_00735 [Pseudomonadota bacterium]|nr:hypothetical protein [Pseudomonadota bacterium]